MTWMVHQLGRRISVLVASVACCAATPVSASGPRAVDALARGQMVRCVPALPKFCGNVHVGCSDRSRVDTYAFAVEPRAGVAIVRPEPGHAAGASQRGPLSFDAANGSAIVGLDPAPAYLRIAADDRFSLRQYDNGNALMAYGRCTPRD